MVEKLFKAEVRKGLESVDMSTILKMVIMTEFDIQALVPVHPLRHRLHLLLKKYQRLVRRVYLSQNPLRPAFGVHATACD